MKIISAPGHYVAAFSPVYFEVEKEAGEDDLAELEIYVRSPRSEPITLRREYLNGKARFDISGVIRSSFAPQPMEASLRGLSDPFLYTRFFIKGVMYCGLRTAYQIAEESPKYEFTAGMPYTLQMIKPAVLYNDFPLDYTVVTRNSAWQDAELMSIARIKVVSPVNGGICVVVRGTVPPAPVYLRWVNALGGIEYFMFSGKSKRKSSYKSATTYLAYLSDGKHEERTYASNGEREITIGADCIDETTLHALESIAGSPLIQLYHKDSQIWETANISKMDCTQYECDRMHEIEFTLTLQPPVNRV